MAGKLFVFGHGYSAQALTRRLAPAGWQVTGTTRDAGGCAGVRASGAEPLIWPGDDVAPALKAASHVLMSIAPGEQGDPVLASCRATLSAAAPSVTWLGYLSTTGVYGDHGGAWVDETTPLTPGTQRGRWRVAAEAAWQEFAAQTGLPLHVFRLSGIYGPGRGPFEKLRAGTARRIVKPGQVFSRIHVDDLAAVLAASMTRPDPGAIYNVCDDDPAPPEDIIAHAAKLLHMPVPRAEPLADANLSDMARSFYAESKRVRNDRIKARLGVRLQYPDYRSGLAALLKG